MIRITFFIWVLFQPVRIAPGLNLQWPSPSPTTLVLKHNSSVWYWRFTSLYLNLIYFHSTQEPLKPSCRSSLNMVPWRQLGDFQRFLGPPSLPMWWVEFAQVLGWACGLDFLLWALEPARTGRDLIPGTMLPCKSCLWPEPLPSEPDLLWCPKTPWSQGVRPQGKDVQKLSQSTVPAALFDLHCCVPCKCHTLLFLAHSLSDSVIPFS